MSRDEIKEIEESQLFHTIVSKLQKEWMKIHGQAPRISSILLRQAEILSFLDLSLLSSLKAVLLR